MIANQEFSPNQVSTVTSTGSISKDNSFLSNDLALETPTSISLSPPDRDLETDEDRETDDNDLELEAPTSISFSPPDTDNDSETETDSETGDRNLKSETPASISLTPSETTDSALDSDNNDSETEADSETGDRNLKSGTPTSISLTPLETTDSSVDNINEADSETGDRNLKSGTPTSISLTPSETTDSALDSDNNDSETEADSETGDRNLKSGTPTSISLTPSETTDSSVDNINEADSETGDRNLKSGTPTSISLTPSETTDSALDSDNNDSETEADSETGDRNLKSGTPTSISLTPLETTDSSLDLDRDNNDSETEADPKSAIAEINDLESPIPISLSALLVELAAPETAAVTIAPNNTSLSVGEFTASSGGKVTVEIAINNAADLQSLDLEIYYDTELLDIRDPIPETEINEGVSRTGIAADWQLLAESGDNPQTELANPIVKVVDDIGDGKTGKIDINLINTSGTPVSGSGKIIAIDFQVSDNVTSESIAKIDLQQAELGMNGQTFNSGDSDFLLNDGNIIVGVDSLDIDGNGTAEPLNDGIVIVRHLFGAEGEGLTNGAIGSGATRTSAAEIKSYLDQIESSLDIDRNGVAEPLNDGILIVRRLFGAEGEGLIDGAIGSGATRTSAADIATAIDNLAI